jgi:hypothetical protein
VNFLPNLEAIQTRGSADQISRGLRRPISASAARAFQREALSPAVEPVLGVLQFLKQRIEQYQPEDHTDPTTDFLRRMLDILKSTLFPRATSVARAFPDVRWITKSATTCLLTKT